MNGGRKSIAECLKRTVQTAHGERIDEEEAMLSLREFSLFDVVGVSSGYGGNPFSGDSVGFLL